MNEPKPVILAINPPRTLAPAWVVDGDVAASRYGQRIPMSVMAGLFKKPEV